MLSISYKGLFQVDLSEATRDLTQLAAMVLEYVFGNKMPIIDIFLHKLEIMH